MPHVNKRRFGFKHPFPILKGAGYVVKTLSDADAGKADDLAARVFGPLADLAFLVAGATTAADSYAVGYKGFALFYEVA